MAAEGAGCHRLGGHDREAHWRWQALEEEVRVTAPLQLGHKTPQGQHGNSQH